MEVLPPPFTGMELATSQPVTHAPFIISGNCQTTPSSFSPYQLYVCRFLKVLVFCFIFFTLQEQLAQIWMGELWIAKLSKDVVLSPKSTKTQLLLGQRAVSQSWTPSQHNRCIMGQCREYQRQSHQTTMSINAFLLLTASKISWVMVSCAYGSWQHEASVVYNFIGKG